MKPRILVLADWYLPGSETGGSVSAIPNLVELVGDEFRFHVIARDRDITEKSVYAGVQTDCWTPTAGMQRPHGPQYSLGLHPMSRSRGPW